MKLEQLFDSLNLENFWTITEWLVVKQQQKWNIWIQIARERERDHNQFDFN